MRHDICLSIGTTNRTSAHHPFFLTIQMLQLQVQPWHNAADQPVQELWLLLGICRICVLLCQPPPVHPSKHPGGLCPLKPGHVVPGRQSHVRHHSSPCLDFANDLIYCSFLSREVRLILAGRRCWWLAYLRQRWEIHDGILHAQDACDPAQPAPAGRQGLRDPSRLWL